MIIAVDCDEVIFETLDAVILWHNDSFGTNLKKSDFTTYDFWDVWGGTREEAIRKTYDFFMSPNAKSIKPVAGAYEVLAELAEMHELVVVTGRRPEFEPITEESIATHYDGIFRDVKHLNHYALGGKQTSKSDMCLELNASHIFEDVAAYANECSMIGVTSVLLKKNWNENEGVFPEVLRIDDWPSVRRSARLQHLF